MIFYKNKFIVSLLLISNVFMKKKRVILWFRQDLRIHDNEAFYDALKSADEVIPLYVFDPRIFHSTNKYGQVKTDKFRAKFIIESVIDLRKSIRKLGSELYVRVGKPEDVIFELAGKVKSSWIFCNRERTQEELDVQNALEQKLWSIGQEVRFSRGKMLYYTSDLPFPVTHTPESFSQFRKEVEKFVPIRPLIEQPTKIQALTKDVVSGVIPSLEDFDLEKFTTDERAVMNFKGGETNALDRLNHYLFESKLVKKYKETRNQLIGPDYSTKFSPWLSQGCLSPKLIYHQVKEFEAKYGANDSTYWVIFELLWRDYFRLIGKKFENKIFQKGGILDRESRTANEDQSLFQSWVDGQTGIPFIDANMRELKHTGFMSNRGRQNVASFLVHKLKLNWQMGAYYFESVLIDYDPCSNYGNWNYLAGVGTDPREHREFNALSQAKKYDSNGDYIRLWIPELSDLPNQFIHQPHLMSEVEQIQYGVRIGEDYPSPITPSMPPSTQRSL